MRVSKWTAPGNPASSHYAYGMTTRDTTTADTPTRETLALDKLVTDTGTQIRSEISEHIVADYVEALGEGAGFPPIVVFRNNGSDVLADGFHRVQAYKKAGRNEIEADVHHGGQDDALWFALGANRTHGHRLNGDDKRKAIELAYKAWPDYSQRKIATQVGCTHAYVGRIRAQLDTSIQLADRVMGRDGRTRPATRPTAKRTPSTTAEDTAPATQLQRTENKSEPTEGLNAEAKAPSTNETGRPGPTAQEQGKVEPPSDEATPSEPARSQRERTGTGVTAKQAAQNRSNKIVSTVVEDAINLNAQEYLVDFTALDQTKLPKWIKDLEEARRRLGSFISRLREHRRDAGMAPGRSVVAEEPAAPRLTT